jgi:TonB family protein
MGHFLHCFEQAREKDPGIGGEVRVWFQISPDGSLASSSIASSTLGNAEVESCLLEVFSTLKWPAAEKPTNVSFPFLFKARGGR